MPRRSKRRPAPSKVASADAARATSAPANRIAVSAAAALRALCAPGTRRTTGTPSKSKREPSAVSFGSASKITGRGASPTRSGGTTASRASARNARNVSSTSRREAYVV